MTVKFVHNAKDMVYGFPAGARPVSGDLVTLLEVGGPIPGGNYRVEWACWRIGTHGPQWLECELKRVAIR